LYVHLYLPVDALCLDGPGWEDRAKHPFDVVFEVIVFFYSIISIFLLFCSLLFIDWIFSQFATEESQHEPLVLFLKDVEKICGNNCTYHGLKNKLEIFPAGVFIIGSQTQTDTRKDKVSHMNLIYSILL
jgi:hypothetical protein